MQSKNDFWRVSAGLFALHASVWIIFSINSFIRPAVQTSGAIVMVYVFAGLMVINALILLLLAWGLFRSVSWIRGIAIAYVVVNLLLTISDQFGWFDFLVLVINVASMATLVATYLNKNGNSTKTHVV